MKNQHIVITIASLIPSCFPPPKKILTTVMLISRHIYRNNHRKQINSNHHITSSIPKTYTPKQNRPNPYIAPSDRNALTLNIAHNNNYGTSTEHCFGTRAVSTAMIADGQLELKYHTADISCNRHWSPGWCKNVFHGARAQTAPSEQLDTAGQACSICGKFEIFD